MSKSSKKRFNLKGILQFIYFYIVPIIGIILFIIIITPLQGIISAINPNLLDVSDLIAILIFMFSVFLPLFIYYMNEFNKNQTLNSSLVMQDDIIPTAFDLLMPKSKVEILIYTSFSIFKDFDKLCEIHKNLNTSKIRVLIKDPDTMMLMNQGKKSDIRDNQVFIAIASLKNRDKELINFRFYRNEPWIRGINVDNKHLFMSNYSVADKNSVLEYTGSKVPWIHLKEEGMKHNLDIINNFSDLFENIWNHCTNYKTIVLDLQGTIFEEGTYNDAFKELPIKYINFKCDGNLQKSKEKIKTYNGYLALGTYSSTGALIKTLIKSSASDSSELEDYIKWKNENLSIDDYPLEEKLELKQALESISNTYKLVLLTNHTKIHTQAILKQLKLENCFNDSNIICIDDCYLIKPDPQLVYYLTEQKNIDIPNSIFIGDRKEIDLDYLRKQALGLIELKNVEKLPTLLKSLECSYAYTKNHFQDTQVIYHK